MIRRFAQIAWILVLCFGFWVGDSNREAGAAEKVMPDPFHQMEGVVYKDAPGMGDRALEDAIRQEVVAAGKTSGSLRYMYNWVDLNNDGSQEAFVLLQDSYFCGSGGCTAYVFQNKGGIFYPTARFTLVNEPVIISEHTVAGWKDIIIRVRGGGTAGGYAVLSHEGESYLRNPSTAPRLAAEIKVTGILLFTGHEVVHTMEIGE